MGDTEKDTLTKLLGNAKVQNLLKENRVLLLGTKYDQGKSLEEKSFEIYLKARIAKLSQNQLDEMAFQTTFRCISAKPVMLRKMLYSEREDDHQEALRDLAFYYEQVENEDRLKARSQQIENEIKTHKEVEYFLEKYGARNLESLLVKKNQ